MLLKSSKRAQTCYPSTDFLKQLILENSKDDGMLGFVIQNPEPDKYAGRTVADVIFFQDDVSINAAEALLAAGHAVAYDGGTKTHDWGVE